VIGKRSTFLFVLMGVATFPLHAFAQNPPGKGGGTDKGTSTIVTRLLAFDKNGDGQLTRDEITDERLARLFDRADTNKDGVVTRDELVALAKAMEAEMGQGGGRGGPGGGFGGPPVGGRRGRGQGGEADGFGGPPGGGRRGPGGMGRPPQPGQILPAPMQERLNLSADQKSQLQELQKDVDAKMDKILTSEQKKQLKDMLNDFGPGGRGGRGRGGPGGRGGRGGPPGGPGGDPDGRGGPPGEPGDRPEGSL
jgi:hypothetical protein